MSSPLGLIITVKNSKSSLSRHLVSVQFSSSFSFSYKLC